MTAAARPLRLLVFGGDGQVGTQLRAIRSPGVEVRALSRREADLSRPESVVDAVRGVDADVVVNAAAYTAVDQAESDRENAWAVNADGPAAMAAACAAVGRPLIHLSTDYVFDGEASGPYAEDAPVRPLNVYGAGKAAGEQAVRDRLDRHLIIRTSWVFAPHGRNFVNSMLRLGETRDRLRVVDDQRGGPTPAGAIAATVVVLAGRAAADPGSCPWGTYHYAGAPTTTWRGFAEAIFAERSRLTGRAPPRIDPIATADYPTPARRPLNSVLDTSRIAAAFDVSPPDWRPATAEAAAAFFAAPS